MEYYEIPERKISASFSDLAGKVAIVTGAAGGIGVGICEYLASQGVKLVANDYSEKKSPVLEQLLDQAGAEYVYANIDISTRSGAEQLADIAQEKYGTPEILVNSAARLGSGPFLKTDEETLIGTTELNIHLCYFISRIVSQRMVEAGIQGSIIHLSSVGGERAHRGQALYDASKGAVNSLTRSMAIDLAKHRIRVNAVVPGATISRHRKYSERMHEQFDKKSPHIPLGRMGCSEDVAAIVGLLASDCSCYVTGSFYHVDGGITAQLAPPGISI